MQQDRQTVATLLSAITDRLAKLHMHSTIHASMDGQARQNKHSHTCAYCTSCTPPTLQHLYVHTSQTTHAPRASNHTAANLNTDSTGSITNTRSKMPDSPQRYHAGRIYHTSFAMQAWQSRQDPGKLLTSSCTHFGLICPWTDLSEQAPTPTH
jgi:hypothetical protein